MINRLLGQLMIVAGVFILLGGVCFGFPSIRIPFQGAFILLTGVVLIVAGAWTILSSSGSKKNGN